MKGGIIRISIAAAAFLLVLAMADSGSAQNRREARGRRLNKSQVQAVVKRVEDRTDNFVRRLDDTLDNSRLNGSVREDWLMKRARDLEGATDELSREFSRRDAWIENRDEVRLCLNIASDIDRNMRRNSYRTATETNWNRVRFELNTLADVYNMPKVGAAAYR